jgi:leucyl aminopeptidase
MANSSLHPAFAPPDGTGTPVTFVTPATWADVRSRLDPRTRAFAETAGFEPRPGRHLLLPGPDGALAEVLFTIENASDTSADPFRAGALPTLLPGRSYRFAEAPADARLAALAFALGTYRFGRYRKPDESMARLELPAGVDGEEVTRVAEGVFLARDLINTPANDMGPAELEEAARTLAARQDHAGR